MSTFNLGDAWDAIGPLLDQALDMDPAERDEWLARLRIERPDVADHLAVLLDAHRALNDDRFLESPAPVPTFIPATPARFVGPYTLIARIGEGGMGTVWAAERHDGEIQRKVAIKFLTSAGRRPEWLQRFLRERQLLSSLNHPAIVQVIDAGHLSEGEPYLVMEYVDGRPIDEYATALPVSERLRLMIGVCDGVAHAHRHLIIHRDLKPSNILVDASGQPKLLDFGIAKLLDDTGDPTDALERVLTPRYASPEQFRGADQTTATDIYSLGAVLYKLTTGRAPKDPGGSSGSSPDADAGSRSIPPASSINPDVPDDVDYILRKALRDEPDQRYPSVDAFAADIRAVLESRPVEARSGDRWYRARKFVRRHQLQVAAAVLIVGSLSGGLYAANRERLIAERRFQQVRQLANKFIALDADLRNIPGATMVRSRIVSESLGYLEELGRETHGDPELSLEIGDAYRQVGEVQGVPVFANLGQYAEAEETLRKGDAFVSGVLAGNARNRRAWLVSAEIQRDWMALVDYQDRRSDAIAHAQRASARLEGFLRLGRPAPAEVDRATQVYMNIATAYSNSNRIAEEIAFCEKALAVSDGVPLAQGRRAAAFGTLAAALLDAGKLDEALASARNSRTLLEALAVEGGRTELFNLSLAYLREGQVLGQDGGISLQRPAEAAQAFERALAVAESLAARDPNDSAARVSSAIAAAHLSDVVRHNDPAKALAIIDHALARTREVTPNARIRFEQAGLLAGSAYPARRLHHDEEARQRLGEALDVLRELKAFPADSVPAGSDVYGVLKAQADDDAESGRTAAAISAYRDLLARIEAAKPRPTEVLADAVVMSDLWGALSRLVRESGGPEEAASLDARQAALWAGWDRTLPGNPFIRSRIARLHSA
jgi:serine/threonine protein kinase/tetratricopeptide (TPR) repeat protein